MSTLLSRRRFSTLAAAAAGAALSARAGLALAAGARTFTDSAGRRVSVPERIQRVFAAGPPATILVYSLAPDALLGWSRAFTPEERGFVPARYVDLPSFGRLTGRGNTANVEVVLAARPDIILDYGSIAPTFASLADRVQEQTGVPYVLIDGAFGAMDRAYEALGELFGSPAPAAELSAYVRTTLARVDAVAARQQHRPRVYYARGPRGLDTALAGSINVESLERAGAINVAGEALGKGGLTSVSMEQVLAWNPEVIVTIDEEFYRGVATDPLWQSVAAVRAKRVYLSPTLPFGWVDFPPSVNRLIGLQWLTAVLYQDRVDELRGQVRDFYGRFFHQTPSDAQLDLLLRDVRGLR
jgi:iron complex transport system substrate-binding protein